VELDARVAGLDAGADDYLANQFELEDLVCAIDTESRRLDPDGIHRDPAVTTD